MNFKYSCIGDNTPENREWLEKVGYKSFDKDEVQGDTLCTVYYSSYQIKNYKLGKTIFQVYLNMFKPINCIGNPQLFRAVTAMREDTSDNQWWVFDEDFDKYKKGDFVMGGFHRCSCYCHVATLEELINHFNSK